VADARKVVGLVHRDAPVAPSAALCRKSAELVLRRGTVPVLAVEAVRRSAVDPFVKLVFRAEDGARFEAVRIPLERAGRFSACVSSQVGCALACAFCATGRMGLRRNLESWEIVEQVRAVRRTIAADGLSGRVHGVVFQGMGEPLANLERVLSAIEVLTCPSAQQIDARNITVCTAGLPTGIRRLAREAPRVRLGLSLGTALPGARRSLMPIDGAHPLEESIEAAAFHARTTGLAPMFAVTLLAGVNDGPEHARALADLARRFAERAGVRPRISVIPYNSIGDGDPFERTTEAREAAFRDVLAACGVFSHKRYSGGGDVAAACGQLAAR
jgi:23S rRNA (adenine2503-C2)-methyltransferase